MPRIFTGLEVPERVAQSLSILRGGLPGARWIDPENYHLTLRFIGDVDDQTEREVASLLGRVRRKPFELRFDAIFPELAAKHAVLLYPFLLDGVAAQAALNQRDGIHPTASGVDRMVTGMLPKVEELIARIRQRGPP